MKRTVRLFANFYERDTRKINISQNLRIGLKFFVRLALNKINYSEDEIDTKFNFTVAFPRYQLLLYYLRSMDNHYLSRIIITSNKLLFVRSEESWVDLHCFGIFMEWGTRACHHPRV